jgi:hypothetical protein
MKLMTSLPKHITGTHKMQRIFTKEHQLITYKCNRYCEVDAHVIFTGLGKPETYRRLNSTAEGTNITYMEKEKELF